MHMNHIDAQAKTLNAALDVVFGISEHRQPAPLAATLYGSLMCASNAGREYVTFNDAMHETLDAALKEAVYLRGYDREVIGIFSLDTKTGQVTTVCDRDEVDEHVTNQRNIRAEG
jgi:hypothetical protein